ncbi:MAG: TonB-dependent receptor plug domain-containing protein, partial [Gammaproteobacteria bacterium]|nr:TonB-dependent receptor plug domain-containing protein [Gammaproteobacteria bacterium]
MTAALVVMASLPAVSYAQEAQQAAGQTDSAAPIEEVVVTGSRIRRTNLVSASPVTQVTSEEVLFQGTVRAEDMVRTLPQVYSDQNTGQSNGATGTATLNLRNLGPERTLVLVNGRRLPAGSPIQGGIGADINQIPSALIDTVEVLTGGASATYGSDAVAGVVNFLMKDDFEGLRFDYQFSQYQHNSRSGKWQDIVEGAGYPAADGSNDDGDTNYMSLIVGGNFEGGRGNNTAYATYRD